jgi:single-strand DNA-binding protein|tara:strand:+ start:157 stop:636 length:480 start_codon:yes stop_codon:yes gene_type:complete
MFMAYSINKVTLVGNIGNEPEVKTFQNGNKVVNLSLATSERWKDKESGEMKTNTEWHKVVIYNPVLADIAEKYVKKGSKIYLEGQLQTRKWQDSSGADKYTTEVVLQNYRGELLLLDRTNDSNSFKGIEGQNQSTQNLNKDSKIDTLNNVENLDDDIPF